MKNKMDSAEITREAWNLFSKFNDNELDKLLGFAGIIASRNRGLKLAQALTNWFRGNVPNIQEMVKLAGETK